MERLATKMITRGAMLAAMSVSCGSPADGGEGVYTGNLTISGQALMGDCIQCIDLPDIDGIQHQTPSGLEATIGRVELLENRDDPAPVPLDTLGDSVFDLVVGATLTGLPLTEIPPGTYTYLRVYLQQTRFTVDATGHAMGMAIPGDLHVDLATADGPDRSQGDYTATFAAAGNEYSYDSSVAIGSYPPLPTADVDTTGNQFIVTMPLPVGSVAITEDLSDSINLTVGFSVDDAFSWIDETGAGNVDGEYDVFPDGVSSEPPVAMVIRGFSIAVDE